MRCLCLTKVVPFNKEFEFLKRTYTDNAEIIPNFFFFIAEKIQKNHFNTTNVVTKMGPRI